MGNDLKKELKNITDKIVKEYKPEKIILFGSHAWGKPNKDSDVDLYIIKETDDVDKIAMKIDRMLFPRQFAMDILVNTPTRVEKRVKMEDFFVLDILNKGKILYEKK